VCGEPALPYDRVNLGKLLSGGADDVAGLVLRLETWYSDHGIDVRLETWITNIDPDTGVATTQTGGRLTFDRVVLCTGSTALVPPLAGADADGVYVFRGPEDCAAILADTGGCSHAAVIGGGLVGLEAAYALARLGVSTTVVHLMERQLDIDAASGIPRDDPRSPFHRLGLA
jgi:nitrite reductase (NADH) large subunit